VNESFRDCSGRKVISRATAKHLGDVSHFLVDAEQRRVAAVFIGRGKNVRLVEWAQVSGFGPDAVMVADGDSLRPPGDDRERDTAEGKLELVGKRVLSERGNELGKVDDVTFDAGSGALKDLVIGDRRLPAGSLLGIGSYAVVLDDDQSSAG
jgi:sporulation protein YlmC with PRC-barrel domain